MGYGIRVNKTSSYVPAGEQIFTSSGIFTVPRGVTKVDVCCVGGGGGGGGGYENFNANGFYLGSGGGGGYVVNRTVRVVPNDNIPILVGAGGGGGIGSYTESDTGHRAVETDGGNGGFSSFGNETDAYYVKADGGYGGQKSLSAGQALTYPRSNGGSGGGFAGSHWDANTTNEGTYTLASDGGSDGSNGYKGYGLYSTRTQGNVSHNTGYDADGGTGQGTTTRAYGDADGTLFAGGGGASGLNYSRLSRYGSYGHNYGYGGSGGGGSGVGDRGVGGSGTANTGGGGAGGGTGASDRAGGSRTGGNGGSGIVLIRWKEGGN